MRLPDIIGRNLGWKAVSLILATLVWIAVRYSREEDLATGIRRSFTGVPITVMTSASDRRAFKVEPGSAEVTVRGERGLVSRLRTSDLTVFVNLTGIAEVKSLRKRIEVLSPPGISLVWVAPKDVYVESGAIAPLPPQEKR
jgi:hypothetical protein